MCVRQGGALKLSPLTVGWRQQEDPHSMLPFDVGHPAYRTLKNLPPCEWPGRQLSVNSSKK